MRAFVRHVPNAGSAALSVGGGERVAGAEAVKSIELEETVLDRSEAVRVMFSHPRGRVRELDEHDVFIETDLTRPTLRLWTRFAPRSMRDEIRAMYLKMHEEKHGDVVAKERAARAERARDHVGRRRHSAAAEKLLAAGSPATRRRSSVPGRS